MHLNLCVFFLLENKNKDDEEREQSNILDIKTEIIKLLRQYVMVFLT